MAEFEADSSQLRAGSNDFKSSASQLENIKAKISRAASSAGRSYDGKLTAKVESISAPSDKTANEFIRKFNSAGSFLSSLSAELDILAAKYGDQISSSFDHAFPLYQNTVISMFAMLSPIVAYGNLLWGLVGENNKARIEDFISKFVSPSSPNPITAITPSGLTVVQAVTSVTVVNPNGVWLKSQPSALVQWNTNLIQDGDSVEIIQVNPRQPNERFTWAYVKTKNGDMGWVPLEVLHREEVSDKDKKKQKQIEENKIEFTDEETKFAYEVPAYHRYRLTGVDNVSLDKDDKNVEDKVALYDRASGSDCTWFAAEAVEKFIGIPLNSGKYKQGGTFSESLGYAGKWPNSIRTNPAYDPYVLKDQYGPGDQTVMVMSPHLMGNDTGHVAFVKSANLVEVEGGKKQWELLIAEENLGKSNIPYHTWAKTLASQDIVYNDHPEVKRWVKVITLSADENGNIIDPRDGKLLNGLDEHGNRVKELEFIHFNPNLRFGSK